MDRKEVASIAKTIDYERAFQNAPVGQAIVHDRIVCACNRVFREIFRGTEQELLGVTVARLYPSQADFEDAGNRTGAILSEQRTFSDDRIMRRLDGELFWVHVRGYSYTPKQPHRQTIWTFTDLSAERKVNSKLRGSMTPRERQVAALLIEGKRAKEIAKALGISPRTVDIYKSRLFRKYGVGSTLALVPRLLSG